MAKGRSCPGPVIQPHEKVSSETQTNEARILNGEGLSMTLLHLELGRRSDTNDVGRSQKDNKEMK